MQLYLVRHGLATWPHWGGPDAERPLTPEGQAGVRAAGAALQRLGARPESVLHSPLARARQTAELLADALGLPEQAREHPALRPGCGPRALAGVLHEHQPLGSLMLVGHAPDMGMLVQALTGANVRFSEASVARIRIEKPDEAPTGTLIWFLSGEALARLGTVP